MSESIVRVLQENLGIRKEVQSKSRKLGKKLHLVGQFCCCNMTKAKKMMNRDVDHSVTTKKQ